MATIALVGNKGGAGKTTLAVNLAAALKVLGRVALIDADPQRSVLQWRAMSDCENGLPVHDAVKALEVTARQLAGDFDHLVIDCPPSVEAVQTRLALRLANVALIPVQPSPLDLWATVHIEHEVDKARQVNPLLRALIVINQFEPRTRLSRMIDQALAEMTVPAARTAIRRRMAYRMSALEGRSVFELGRHGTAAGEEIQQLMREVMSA
jgi:chromosome partitioning protein